MFPDPAHMRTALRMARKGAGRTSPNPAVGAVVVKGGRVVGAGWHRGAGLPHAEVEALAEAGERARGGDLYVTLEPCCHTGRTGPCTEAILSAGIRRVAAAMEDPNPLVSGRGLVRLREAGVTVDAGLMERQARLLNLAWIHWIRTGRPHVTLKLAISLDGQIAGASGDSRWISGEASRKIVHRMRSECDAVLVGGGTVRKDDPLLTSRIRGGRDPRRVVVTSDLAGLSKRRFFSEGADRNIVFCPRGSDRAAAERLRREGADVEFLPAPGGRMKAADVLDRLGKRGIVSLLVEGGGTVAGWLVEAGAVDRLALFLAPLLLGEAVRAVSGWAARRPADGMPLEIVSVRKVGADLLLSAAPVGRVRERRG